MSLVMGLVNNLALISLLHEGEMVLMQGVPASIC